MKFQLNVRGVFFALSVCGLFAIGDAIAAVPDPATTVPADPVAGAVPTEKTDDTKKEKEKEEKVVTGVIASQGRYGQFAHVAVETAGSSPGDEGGVLSGSVVWTKGDICKATITNNGEKSYSVSFAIVGVDGRGTKAFRKTGSGTVAPKGSITREVTGCKKDLNLALDVTSATAKK